MARPAVSGFGKVRVEAEFIGIAEGQPQIGFAQWLDEGIGYAVDRGGAGWRERFLGSRPHAFIYRAPPKSKASSVLLGVLGPSEDRFARPFPYAVMTELRESSFAGGASSLPVAAERFVAEAVEVCRSLPTTTRSSDLLARTKDLNAPVLEECTEAAQDLTDWQAREGIVGKLWERLFPEGGAATAERAFRSLVDAVVPMRTHGAIGTNRAVRLPLGHGGAAAVSFWLEVVRALAQWNRTVPAVFWPADQAAGAVLIQLGEVPSTSFAQLWTDAGPDPLIIDLSQSDLPTDSPALRPDLGRVLKNPRARVRDLIDQLERLR